MWLLHRRLVPALLVFAVAGSALADDAERKMTDRVDRLLQQSWKNADVQPAPRADDAVFLRRAYLDLTGVIPSVGEVREFLRDARPGKRERLIEKLLGTGGKSGNARRNGSSRHATHLANIWQQVMLPQVNNNPRFRFQAGTFNAWLRNHFAENTPYDRMVAELITYSGPAGRGGPGLFYQVLELKPEELAASTSRIFLGVQIQCAQCHNHPFDHWTQKDFWSYAAFFAQLNRPRGRSRFVAQIGDAKSGEVTLPNTQIVVLPRYLGAKPMKLPAGSVRRRELARWLTSKQNPYFAKATVNRVWAILFGYGLVDPVDDFGKHNPASHPRLLEALAKDFAESGYDLRRLFRVLAKTKAYQLSSQVTATDSYQPNLFNRMAVKSLTAEQIFDCFEIATAKRELPTAYGSSGQVRYRVNSARQQFLAKFEAPTQKATEFQAGIPQALTMMNGPLVAEATDVDRSDILIALADSPFMNTEQRVETLFLAALSRMPTPKERSRFVAYVDSGGRSGDSRQALGDVMWALLNSTEFILNH